jgi:NTP pyrophosphatase (non-canonical NTP hydrolase)
MSVDWKALNAMSDDIHHRNVEAGWWTNMDTGKSLLGKNSKGKDRRNVPEMLCLIHSEVSEAMEGYRKNLADTHLKHRSMFEVELADVLIRLFDLAGAHGLDLGGAVEEKLLYNSTRNDHKVENRKKTGGKAF